MHSKNFSFWFKNTWKVIIHHVALKQYKSHLNHCISSVLLYTLKHDINILHNI